VYADNASIWHHMSDALHQSLYRVLSLLIAILPGILAFFVALAVFTLIGMALSALLRRDLPWAKFDDYLTHTRARQPTGHRQLRPRRSSPGLLLGLRPARTHHRRLRLRCLLRNGRNAPHLAAALPHPRVGAIFLLIAGTLIARFLARSVLIGAVNAQLQYARFLSLGVKWLVLVLTAAMVLDHLEVGGVVVELAFGILFGGIVLTLSLAVGLGSRDLVSRSLESHVERTGEHGVTDMPPRTSPCSTASPSIY
jgi:hypothetical protein